jgi:hypothetical protein
MGDLPVQLSAPALLANPATASLATDHLERWQVIGMVPEADEAPGVQQFDQFAAIVRPGAGCSVEG